MKTPHLRRSRTARSLALAGLLIGATISLTGTAAAQEITAAAAAEYNEATALISAWKISIS